MNTKKIPLIILYLLSCSINLLAEKYALVIGVGTYPVSSGWRNLSAENDIYHITSALQLNGFSKENFITLLNEQATKRNIVKAFNQLQQMVHQGDIAFIHFSGHGQQVMDDNEDEIDRLDEAIVPYDSPRDYQAGYYHGERLIRDDELNQLTADIRRKIGSSGQVILVLDACHSGTGVRGKAIARGTNIIMAPNSFQVDTMVSIKKTSMEIDTYREQVDFAPMASFFGSSANEANFQTRDDQFQPVGTLTYILSSLLANLSHRMTFQEIYERIQLKTRAIQPRQNPQWEGPKDELLFGGEDYQETATFFSVNNRISDRTITAEVGTLVGVYEGSQIEVYSLDQQRVINEGYISKANLIESIITLKDPLQTKYDELLKIKIKTKAQALLKTYIQFDIAPNTQWNSVVESVKRNSFIQESHQSPDLYLTTNNTGKQLLLVTPGGNTIFESTPIHLGSNNISYRLIRAIKSYTQGKFLRGYDNQHPSYHFSIQLLATDSDMPTQNIQQLRSLNGNNISVGTNIQIAVTNHGSTAAYFTLLDIQPDNQLNVLIPLPYADYTAEDFFLQPGNTYLTDYVLEISEPRGDEALKLICSDKPLDLSSIIQRRGKPTRGENKLHSFEQIFAFSFQDDSRRKERMEAVSREKIGTFTRFFRIE